jgi:hypothetical protein
LEVTGVPSKTGDINPKPISRTAGRPWEQSFCFYMHHERSMRRTGASYNFLKIAGFDPKHGVGLSFPAFGFGGPGQKGWTGLKPEAPKTLSDPKQKKRRSAVFPIL